MKKITQDVAMGRRLKGEQMIDRQRCVTSRLSISLSLRSVSKARSLLLSLVALAFAQWDYRSALAADDFLLEQERPSIKADRSQEDWSLLADPKLRTQPLDSLKYIPLFPSNPD
ncbi:alginate export family protein, partial [Rhizobium ruizarguesonis]